MENLNPFRHSGKCRTISAWPGGKKPKPTKKPTNKTHKQTKTPTQTNKQKIKQQKKTNNNNYHLRNKMENKLIKQERKTYKFTDEEITES